MKPAPSRVPRLSAGDLRSLRELARQRGATLDDVDDRALAAVHARTRDLDLAATALAMRPRPEWVDEILLQP